MALVMRAVLSLAPSVWRQCRCCAVLFALLVGFALTVLDRASAAPPPVPATVRAQLLKLKKEHGPPLYYLGTSYDGLALIRVEEEGSGPVGFTYADCTADELDSLSLNCHRGLSIDNWPPTPGEISTQGRCIFSTVIRGAMAAVFPITPHALTIFTGGLTIEVSSPSRRRAIAAARALRGLNLNRPAVRPFPPRNFTRLLGTCKAPAQKPAPKLTAKQRYELRIKSSWTIQSASAVSLGGLNPQAADPNALAAEFLHDTRTFSALLRNEATRIDMITPPAAVADLQPELTAELRAYATDVDRILALVQTGAWRDSTTFAPQRADFGARAQALADHLVAIVEAFQRRGYTIYAKETH
jgi:hypothetical protein